VVSGITWLLNLQNRDGGIPTFCRGWGYLPFDRSSADLTAHTLRAFRLWSRRLPADHPLQERMKVATDRGMRYLDRMQRADGSWLPLWFGNQHAPDDENPTYGTARVLAAYRDLGHWESPAAQRGRDWLCRMQNPDGGWGAGSDTPSSVEETALAVEILAGDDHARQAVRRGAEWLIERVETGRFTEAAPIGFYFAKLWYFEKLYPIIFTVAALRRVNEKLSGEPAESMGVAAVQAR
jgi:squalene-hopene/tetraprenyl-beta-curcumene cyclase